MVNIRTKPLGLGSKKSWRHNSEVASRSPLEQNLYGKLTRFVGGERCS